MKLSKRLAGVGIGLAALLLTAACGGGSNPLAEGSGSPSAGGSASGSSGPIVVGSAGFEESQIIAELYAQAMKAKGLDVSTKHAIGAREVYIKALQDKSISVVPEYTGNLLLYFDKNATASTAEEVEAALPKALPSDLKVLNKSAAVDQDVYVVTKDTSTKNGITSIPDLSKIASSSTLGGPSELEDRPYGPTGLEKVYGVKFKAFQPYDKLPVKVADLNAGKIQVATFFTTDSAIADNGYVKLEDPKSLILPQNVVPLVRSEVASNQTAVDAMNAVQAALTTDDLVALDKAVIDDHQDPDQVAGDWLKQKGLA
ncbi:ABC transporter substrate-binding protein [Microlunatus ginsengisoli]|uniref:ABC transporter substrate-binding protein n=1 Tax=Microlunatus ginsengisoli TaxID=363863 RepID=A0ABP7AQK3_9ACTN